MKRIYIYAAVFIFSLSLISYAYSSGSLDLSFASGGVASIGFTGKNAMARTIAVQADGKIIAAGGVTQSNAPYYTAKDFVLSRFTPAGLLDSSFGTAGTVITDFDGGNDEIRAVALRPDGKIIAVGPVTSVGEPGTQFGIARYNTNGTLDSTFNYNGKAVYPVLGLGDQANGVTLLANGQILIVGSAQTSGSPNSLFAMMILNPNGSLSKTAFPQGVYRGAAGSHDNILISAAVQSDGKIVAVGYNSSFSSANAQVTALRFTTNGFLDSSFGQGGTVALPYGPLAGSHLNNDLGVMPNGASVTILSSGQILLGGSAYSTATKDDFAVFRLNPNGKLDSSFGQAGAAVADFSAGSDDVFTGLVVQSDGKIVLAGTSNMQFGLVRYVSAGTLDLTFGTSGITTGRLGSGADQVGAIGMQTDGKAILTGLINLYSGGAFTNAIGLARYLS